MNTEYEGRIPKIYPPDVSKLIISHGGKCLGQYLMRRYVYDITPGDKSRWIRLRDSGKEVTLAVKQILHEGIDGVLEEEIVVNDFEATNRLLNLLGFTPKAYQENRRTSFVLDGARLEIDEWPMIPPYLEIEADSEEKICAIAEKLGYRYCDVYPSSFLTTARIYRFYGMDLEQIKELRF